MAENVSEFGNFRLWKIFSGFKRFSLKKISLTRC